MTLTPKKAEVRVSVRGMPLLTPYQFSITAMAGHAVRGELTMDQRAASELARLVTGNDTIDALAILDNQASDLDLLADPPISVTVRYGNTTREWKFFPVGPRLRVNRRITFVLQAVDVSARLGLFQPSIYKTSATYKGTTQADTKDLGDINTRLLVEAVTKALGSTDEKTAINSLGKLMVVFYQTATRMWNESRKAERQYWANPLDGRLVDAIHARNMRVWPDVKALLESESGSWPNALKFIKNSSYKQLNMFALTKFGNILFQDIGGFWGPGVSIVSTLAEALAWQVVWRPTASYPYKLISDMWRFRPESNQVPQIQLYADSLSADLSSDTLRVSHVLVTNSTADNARSTVKTGPRPDVKMQTQSQRVATNVYPKTGFDQLLRVINTEAPVWVGSGLSVDRPTLHTSYTVERQKKPSKLSLQAYAQSLADSDAFVYRIRTDLIDPVCQDWAMYKFGVLGMQGRTLSISSSELNLEAELGYRYRVQLGNSQRSLFGFLDGITHTLAVDGEAGTANTSFAFTQVSDKVDMFSNAAEQPSL